jgi:hypothetical protein
MLEKENKRDETIPKAVSDHLRDKTLSPQRHERQYKSNQENGYQPAPALVQMSKSENTPLQNTGSHRVTAQGLKLSLYVSAEDKFFDKAGAERRQQKSECFNSILRNHRPESGAIVLQRSQYRIRQISDHCHHYEGGNGDARITSDHTPASPFHSHQFLPGDPSAASDAGKRNGETHPQESGQNETELQGRLEYAAGFAD